MTIITMDLLKEGSIRLYTGMTSVFLQFECEEQINIKELEKEFNNCYAMNNSVICFVCNNEVFVTPYTHTKINCLNSSGFQEKNFWVPFSNGEYPKYQKVKWDGLREIATESLKRDFIKKCIDYSDKHKIGEISKKTLMKCFNIPISGINVKHQDFKTRYYPIVNSKSPSFNKLGHFSANGNRVVFTYRDGKTYVAKNLAIIKELLEAGYTELDMLVPFSNGEEIQDPIFKKQWEDL